MILDELPKYPKEKTLSRVQVHQNFSIIDNLREAIIKKGDSLESKNEQCELKNQQMREKKNQLSDLKAQNQLLEAISKTLKSYLDDVRK